MPFSQARADEFLMTSRAGRLTDPGASGSALLLPGATWIKVQIKGAVADVCLGELRNVVSPMTMKACIEELKTARTDAGSS